ncbi:peptide ABC transporter ATP-binding protein [Chryseomicrobium excrementi]|uniref:Peptide ABC transporter ATP-binding protein n=1 Tax=Chryseomicrobium excrementi TaxID=2041346 RepID=A0A2M9F0H3_9BACL|nr:ABC transporter ATP-binding protein [Chryseomicrobium excrementi]PJK16945.1 peptide ABC transporter ATP-binding protein [Chryseomicrobium excrementi]
MKNLLEVHHLSKDFQHKRQPPVSILQEIQLQLGKGQTLCVVGESGCGKTTLGRVLAGLLPATTGTYSFLGKDVTRLSKKEKKEFRRDVQLIHQNPYESLNPTTMVFDILANPLRKHKKMKTIAELYPEVTRLLELVGLTPVSDFVDKYPSHLSGGQRQRVSIARVLAMDPKLIVVDEATSMIDTSLRINLLKTLQEIQERTNVSYFFITHDLALGRYFAQNQQLMVMYLGKIIEKGQTEELIGQPLHPYTKAILSAAAGNKGLLDESSEFETYVLGGTDIPSFTQIPQGCPLHPRCPQKIEGLCDRLRPPEIESTTGHYVACHLYRKSDSPL